MNATRILLAEDDEEFVELLQPFLSERGYECEAVNDGLRCLSMLRQFEPDILVLDNDLLWGGAEGVLVQMRSEPSFCRIAVIFTSGEITPSLARVVAGPPVVAHLEKPFSLRELLSVIDTAHRQAKQEACV
jgi:DNA-binding response OmpR family regulator